MPGLADALTTKPAPSVQAPPTKAVTAASPSGNGAPTVAGAPAPKAPPTAAGSARPEAPAGQHAAPGRPDAQTQAAPTKQAANAKAGKADEQEWWTE
jgi:hypothetical protein